MCIFNSINNKIRFITYFEQITLYKNYFYIIVFVNKLTTIKYYIPL